jgi:uncharacterized protein
MQIYKIQDDNVWLIYHPGEDKASVGSQYLIKEKTEAEKNNGIIVQVIANETLDYPGIIQEMMQDSLEHHFRIKFHLPLNRELNDGFSDVKSLKVAHAKIRKQVVDGKIRNWEGWIPTRNVDIEVFSNEMVARDIVLNENIKFSLDICEYNEKPISLDATKLDMINVITGIKGSGKSHTAKNILLRLVNLGLPCIVFDVNNEYNFDNCIDLKLGENFKFDMSKMEPFQVFEIINSIFPLPERTAENFRNTIYDAFDAIRKHYEKHNQQFVIDIDTLLQPNVIQVLIPGSNNERYIKTMRENIETALRLIKNRNIFISHNHSFQENEVKDLFCAYEEALQSRKFIRLQLNGLPQRTQKILVESVNNQIIQICDQEYKSGRGMYPFIFFEEAHMYIDQNAIIDFATRGRHIGIRMFFVTNTPDALPELIFRQLDNLFLLHLTHSSDIKNVSKSSFTDEDTVKNIATRMPLHHLMIIGNITNNYPLVVKGTDLPENAPKTTGATRNVWKGLENRQVNNDNQG